MTRRDNLSDGDCVRAEARDAGPASTRTDLQKATPDPKTYS